MQRYKTVCKLKIIFKKLRTSCLYPFFHLYKNFSKQDLFFLHLSKKTIQIQQFILLLPTIQQFHFHK